VRFFFNNLSSILISLILALLVWIAAVREQNPPREGEYNQSIPIEVISPAPDFIVTDPLPETVRVRLLAPENSWETLTLSKFKASIDLSQLETGFNDVPVAVAVSDPQVEIVDLTPSAVTVNLEALQTITVPVEIEIMDSAPLGYVNRTPIVEPLNVAVTGPASLIDQVDQAASQVFIRNSKETVQVVREVLVRTRDDQPLRGVQVEPSTVAVTVPVEQRFGYKDVSVQVRVQGRVAAGYRVSNITVDPPTLTIVGNPQGLSEIAGLVETAPINLDDATEDIVRVVPLNLPNGVTTVFSDTQANGPGGVRITVAVTPIEDGITLQRPITQQGVDDGYWWRAVPDSVDVFLSGPLTQLQTLRASDVGVIVDLFGLAPGVYKLNPTVFRPDELRVDTILPDTVEVTIGRAIPRPVVQQELFNSYSWTPSPTRVVVNLVGPAEQLLALSPGDVEVIVDLADLEPGLYRVRPIVSLPEGSQLDSIRPETVEITIQPKIQTTITPGITATQTISTQATATPDAKKD